jgi:acetylornithine deacetylase/succinyl-diaminopimelate desuccinylase-like protein
VRRAPLAVHAALGQDACDEREADMASRDGAVARARAAFDSGAFRERLAALVAIPSTSQDPEHAPALHAYLAGGLAPWLGALGFARVTVHDNPEAGFGPILTAERIEDPARPTVLLYGHGDTVRGLDSQWSAGLSPWVLTERDGRWYGRGSADNKGQHAVNLAALEAVLAERGGRLGFNIKLLVETAEERGSRGLREFVAAHRALLAADALIASDGPRVTPTTPTVSCGTRGTYHFDLVCALRQGGVHSGHWGGLTADPALLVAHAIATIADAKGRVRVRGLLPDAMPQSVRAALEGCPLDGGGESAQPTQGWGEPGLTDAEKVFGWNSFIVLAMVSGEPAAPVNAVAPHARAHCQIRYTVDSDTERFAPAIRAALDEAGLSLVTIENAGVRMAASRTDPANPWVRFAADSLARTLGKRVQVIPNAAGGLPGDVFVDHLGVPLVWVPHSYSGCKQHGPDEHLLAANAREAIMGFAGLWWDCGER